MHKKMPENEIAANLDRRLAETVALLRATLEATADGILVVDANGQFTAYNRRFTEMWRLPDHVMERNDDAAALQHVLEQLSDPDQFLAKVRDLYDHPTETSFDVLNFKDGRIFERYSMPQIVGGEVRGRVWSFRNATQRESAVQALEQEVHRRRTHFAQSRDGIVVVDEAGGVFEANERFAEMLGYTFAEVHELRVWDWDASLSRPDIEGMVASVDESGDHFETRHRRKDGALIDVEISTTALTMSGRKFIHCTCRDVTERRLAEAALRASEAAYRSLFDAIADGILVMDTDGRLVDANPAAEAMFGLRRDRLAGLSLADLADPDKASGADLDRLLALAQEGKAQSFALPARSAAGGAFPADVILTPLPHKGRDAIVAAVRDVSQRVAAEEERRQLQSQLLQAQKMDAIGQLTGGIAHDFNNMLGVVLGYADLAAAALAERNSAPVDGYLSEISRAVDRARNLVTKMLAFGRAPVGAEADPQELAPLVQDTVSMLRPTLPTSLGITMVMDSDVPAVPIDPAALQQILTNLLLNAAHATEGCGKVAVELNRAHLETEQCDVCAAHLRGDHVQLAVRDDGCGMPDDVLRRIFEPFYTTKPKGEGHGMGLAVINGLLRAYGGHIKVASRPGAGTEFRILLPFGERTAAPASAAVSERGAGRPGERHLMVVDDQLPLAEMVAEMLASRGYRVSVCGDAAAALEQFRREPAAYDAVLSDQTMPGMSGRELLQAMREVRPELPVMIWSGFSETMNADIARQLGFDAYLAKPVTMQELLSALEGVFADGGAH